MSTKPQIKPATCKAVVIEGLALMKIIKHCREKGNPVCGQIIGMEGELTRDLGEDSNGEPSPEPVLEVINCVPEPENAAQYDYISAIRDTFHDGDVVGLYSSDYFGDYYEAELISILYDYQLNFPNAVLIVFDPVRTQKGYIALRALRLSDAYMELHSNTTTFSQQEFAKFGIENPAEIFDQVPLYIHNHHLCHTYLLSLADNFNFIHSIGDRFNVLTNGLPENMIRTTGNVIDQYTSDTESHNKSAAYIAKQRQELAKRADHVSAENIRRKRAGLSALPEVDTNQMANLTDPSYINNALMAGRLVTLSHDLNALTSQSYNRHLLLQTLMRPTPEKKAT